MIPSLKKIDKKIIKFLRKVDIPFLRYSLATIFIWFGALKTLGLSPAQTLVQNTVYWFNPSWFVPFLGWWEVLIGICLLWKPLIRLGLLLMALQMVGTFLPIFLLPKVVFGSPFYALTLEGQYIIKNIILIGAGLVVGAHVKEN